MKHVLDQRMRYILAQMELFLSYGPTQTFDKSGSRMKATGGDRPSGDSHPVHELYAAMYSRCDTNDQRENVIAEAEAEYGRLSKQDRSDPEPGSFHWKRRIAARSDVSDGELCRLYSISRTTLWRYRRDYA